MRILLVNDSSTPTGGAEIMSLSLRDALRGRGHDAILFSSRALYGDAQIAADETCFGTVTQLRQFLRLANPSALRQLRRVLREFRPDVVHVRMMTTQLSPLILPLLRNVPSVYHATWHEMICPTGMKMLPDLTICREPAGMACWRNGCVSATAWPLLSAQQQLLRRWRGVFTRVVANSHYLARQLESAGWSPVDVIWNGVPDVEPRGPLVDPPLIGFSGRLIPEKGAETVIRALSLLLKFLPDVRLLIVGDGPQRMGLERLCEELGVVSAVEMTGALSRSESEERLRSAWIQVVPSICQESFGLVAAEAQMRGTAVVAARRGGLSEIVLDGETGALVEPQNPEQLAAALRRFLSHRGRSEQIGQAGRLHALREFRLETCVSRFLDLYSRVIAEHQAAAASRCVP